MQLRLSILMGYIRPGIVDFVIPSLSEVVITHKRDGHHQASDPFMMLTTCLTGLGLSLNILIAKPHVTVVQNIRLRNIMINSRSALGEIFSGAPAHSLLIRVKELSQP